MYIYVFNIHIYIYICIYIYIYIYISQAPRPLDPTHDPLIGAQLLRRRKGTRGLGLCTGMRIRERFKWV